MRACGRMYVDARVLSVMLRPAGTDLAYPGRPHANGVVPGEEHGRASQNSAWP